MVEIVKRTTFTAADGKLFLDYQEAWEYETRQKLVKFMKDTGIGRGGDWRLMDIEESIWDNRKELVKILSQEIPPNGEG